jgi:hypothetical protein
MAADVERLAVAHPSRRIIPLPDEHCSRGHAESSTCASFAH